MHNITFNIIEQLARVPALLCRLWRVTYSRAFGALMCGCVTHDRALSALMCEGHVTNTNFMKLRLKITHKPSLTWMHAKMTELVT